MLETKEAYLTEFDADRAWLREPDLFQRFRVPEEGEPLADANLDPTEMLLIVERGDARRAFLVRQISYHHLAQGGLDGEPYLVSFCTVCHSGGGMDPRIEGRIYHFSAGGLYNGLVLLIDDETRTYWDHIRGLGLHGPLRGAQMETFPLEITNVRTALRSDRELTVSLSKPKRAARVFGWMSRHTFRRKGFLPPGFRRTMRGRDDRLPEMTHGLGVMTGEVQRFYPMSRIAKGIEDELASRPLRIQVDPETQVPTAVWSDDGTRPMQIFSRWYGFVATFPRTEVFSPVD
ncbi:MAG: DUF3179 domain-containing (seleno)protein [Thermoplasmata archaeon]